MRSPVLAAAALLALAGLLLAGAGSAPASPAAGQEVTIVADDGVSLAGTLFLPAGAPPEGGWPGLVFLHGLGGDRGQMNALAQQAGFLDGTYAVLTVDARGHGGSGGLVSVAGPREVADARLVRDWLAARPDVSDTRIGVWGISYGGGIALNSLTAGVPWAAVAVFETWSDLYEALLPQGVVKSGVVAALAASIPEARRDPQLVALQAAAFAGNAAAARPWARERSSLERLPSVTAPVFFAQGRRDFLFGLDQGTEVFRRLRGPKALYVGLHGHAPSTFPAADTGYALAQARAFLDCHLLQRGCGSVPAVAVAPERFAGAAARFAGLPRTRTATIPLPGVSTFARPGKAVRSAPPLRAPLELFGNPTVQVPVAASGGWSRLVAVLTARTPQGQDLVVSAGAAPTRPGARRLTVRLIGQATYLPRGTRLTLTLASSSTAQSPSNLLYLDLPMPPRARVRVGPALLRLPALRSPVTR